MGILAKTLFLPLNASAVKMAFWRTTWAVPHGRGLAYNANLGSQETNPAE
jgi:hypothetical protein